MKNYETFVELEQAIERSKSRIELEGNVVASLTLAGVQGRDILCVGREIGDGEAQVGVVDAGDGVLFGCIFTSEARALEAEMEYVRVDLADYLCDLALDEDVDGLFINAGTQDIFIGREELDLIYEVLEKAYDEKQKTAAIRGFVNLMEGYEWIPDRACALAGAKVEFSDAAKETIQHVNYYMDGKNSFALINDHVAYMSKFNPKKGHDLYLDKLQEEVKKVMDEAGCYHPDFAKYVMDDGMLAVKLFNGVWCFRDPADYEDPYDMDGEPSMEVALEMRQEILDACEAGKVLAYVINDMESED